MSNPLLSPKLTAILGPTNTGKTHYAVERMIARSSGVIGLPLRLLAREVYDKICKLKGARNCALVTGEEKIIPEHARYYVCTVEAMPQSRFFAFAAIDEVQMMNNHERGHIFTDRVLHYRGTEETLFLGAETARPVLKSLVPDIQFEYRERFSTLTHAGPAKLTRLPKRSVIVAFSTREVYAIAELLRRYRGGAAIVMGGLSPRTRNAQAELFQSGEVDFMVATDAVGMGLNLDTQHVAFAGLSKFDGRRRRILTPMEAAQIAGRAGRFRNDGTFGTTGDCIPFDDEIVERIENHRFDALNSVEWRHADLDFSSLEALSNTLHTPRPNRVLRRVKGATDELAFERLSALPEIMKTIHNRGDVKRLWDICQVPDFHNLTLDVHVRLLQDLYHQLIQNQGKLPNAYLQRQVERLDNSLGGVDILSQRLAQIRVWTYCANTISWTDDPKHWINRTREVEDRLSDALHENLIARFIDRRTRALLKGMGTGKLVNTTVKDNGEVWADEHKIGQLDGLKFTLDSDPSNADAEALKQAAEAAIAPEINRRLTSLCGGTHDIFTLSEKGEILWGGAAVGRIAASGSVFTPDAELIGGELGQDIMQTMAVERMRDYLRSEVSKHLAPLQALKTFSEDETASASARGFAYTLFSEHGALERYKHFKEIKALEQDARKPLRELGIVFGQYTIYMRDLMKPKPSLILSLLLSFGVGGDKRPFIPFAGMTSLPNTGDMDSNGFTADAIKVAGYRACGPRIIRLDILNRLSMLIRQAQNEYAETGADKPGFQIMQEMLSLLGSTYEEVRGVLESLNYVSETREAITPSAPEPDIDAEPEATQAEITANDTSDSHTAAPETAAADAPTETVTAPQKKTGSKRLNVHHQRVTDEDGKTTEIPNTEFWTMAQRQPHRQHKPNTSSKSKRHPKGPRHKQAYDKRAKQPQKQIRPEDSPFAALAALKTDAPDSDAKS